MKKLITGLALALVLASAALAAPMAMCCDVSKSKTACCKVACCDAPCGSTAKVKAHGSVKTSTATKGDKTALCAMPCCNGGACCSGSCCG